MKYLLIFSLLIQGNVYRKGSNIYQFRTIFTSYIVETSGCYEFAYGEEGVLRYDKYSFDNKLIFDNGAVCNVVEVR